MRLSWLRGSSTWTQRAGVVPLLAVVALIVVSCSSDDGCDPSTPCGTPPGFSLEVVVRDENGAPVSGLEVFGYTQERLPLSPLEYLENPPGSSLTSRPVAVLGFSLATSSYVLLQIFDSRDTLVRTLVEDDIFRPAGIFNVAWNTLDDLQNPLPGGLYRAVFTASDSARTAVYTSNDLGFLSGATAAFGQTDNEGRLSTTDARSFPGIDTPELKLPFRTTNCDSADSFDLGGGERLLLRDGSGNESVHSVDLIAGPNTVELTWCPTCPSQTVQLPGHHAGPGARGSSWSTRGGPRLDTDPVPVPGTFGFKGFCPNPFN